MKGLRILAVVMTTLAVGIPLRAPGRSAKKTPVTITLGATPLAIDPGRPARLSGRITSSRASCIARRSVTLSSSSTPDQVGKTNKKGRFKFDQVVVDDTTFRVTSAGSSRCKAGTSPGRTVTVFQPPPPMLEGPPTGPAADAIPDAPFPNPRPEDFETSETIGADISTRELLLGFAPGVTIGQANGLLTGFGGEIIGGDPEASWVLVRLDGTRSPDDILALMDQLGSDPMVDLVVPEALMQTDIVPVPDPAPFDPPGGAPSADWTWTRPPKGGNWGLEASRAPQAWNLLTELKRSEATSPIVGVIDHGFDPDNPDLKATGTGAGETALLELENLGGRNPNPTTVADKFHGTATSGVISARFGNSKYLDGIAPRTRNTTTTIGLPWRSGASLTPLEQQQLANRQNLFLIRGVEDMFRFRTKHPEIKIFNWSGSFKFDDCHPDQSTAWLASGEAGTGQQTAAAQKFVSAAGKAFAKKFPALDSPAGVILFASSGNASDIDTNNPKYPMSASCTGAHPNKSISIPAKWSSPWCNASIEHATPGIVCVEATRLPLGSETGYHLTNFSNPGGAMAAPGAALATLGSGNDIVKYPIFGTSFSSPMTAGAAAWIYALGNRSGHGATPAQDLSVQQLRDLIVARTGVASDGTTKILDMFYAVMGLDLLEGNKLIQKALVDVDDGSLDGNSRLDDDDADGDGNFTEPFPDGIVTPDGMRGDGSVGMRDFRAFRDALLSGAVARAESPLTNDLVDLNGPVTHFKFDYNFDGCVGRQKAQPAHPDPTLRGKDCGLGSKENVYPRYDFNGDGKVDGEKIDPPVDHVAPFKVAPNTTCTALNTPAGCLRDIDVIADPAVWALDEQSVYVTDTPPIDMSCDDSPRWVPSMKLTLDRSPAPDGVVDFIYSADVHFSVETDPTGDMDKVFLEVSTELPDGDSVDNDGDGKVDERFDQKITRCLNAMPAPQKASVTMPLFTRALRVTVIGRDDEVDGGGALSPDPYNFCHDYMNVKYGQDLRIRAKAQVGGASANDC